MRTTEAISTLKYIERVFKSILLKKFTPSGYYIFIFIIIWNFIFLFEFLQRLSKLTKINLKPVINIID
ncbi:hypothetical protein H8356DRAFT_1323227 [Neocallimastix lanati (nom. inval.)]|nr:hypothetical protein H8356DRAFT_1323227 [Neocallimastix sp. JGI-2020a]